MAKKLNWKEKLVIVLIAGLICGVIGGSIGVYIFQSPPMFGIGFLVGLFVPIAIYLEFN